VERLNLRPAARTAWLGLVEGGLGPSVFYNMERAETNGYFNYFEDLQP
jgi:hypothetical protein